VRIDPPGVTLASLTDEETLAEQQPSALTAGQTQGDMAPPEADAPYRKATAGAGTCYWRQGYQPGQGLHLHRPRRSQIWVCPMLQFPGNQHPAFCTKDKFVVG
jgi:hypothetical protein